MTTNERELLVELLSKLGISANLLGYHYIMRAVELVKDDLSVGRACPMVTKHIYPQIAKEFYTTPSRVERAIRTAIDKRWDRAGDYTRMRIFGDTRLSKRPTNAEFIASLAQYIISHDTFEDMPRDTPRDMPRDTPRDTPRDLLDEFVIRLAEKLPFINPIYFVNVAEEMRKELYKNE